MATALHFNAGITADGFTDRNRSTNYYRGVPVTPADLSPFDPSRKGRPMMYRGVHFDGGQLDAAPANAAPRVQFYRGVYF